ncbi:hypothetical protein R6Q57_012662 [Mikania cordata]
MRTQNYSFFKEYAGAEDTVVCGNRKGSRVFRDSVRQAISDAVRDAPRSINYFARKQALSDSADDSAYVLADCWNTLDESINDQYQVINSTCGNERATSESFIPSFVKAMDSVSTQLNESMFGFAVGDNNNLTYALGQCYGDMPTKDCPMCYAIGRTVIPNCLPCTGGRVYLNGCFLRYENYSFFEEYTGQDDRSICTNTTRRNNVFEQSVKKVVAEAVETAPKTNNYYARPEILISGTENQLVYAQADCLRTLDAGSCEKCLQNAAKSMLDCLPSSEGYALYTGCIMRYADSKSSNPHHKRLSKVIILPIVMAVSSMVALLVAFYAWKLKLKSKRKGSNDIKLLNMLNRSSLNFKYSTILKATNAFDEANKLGQGGFGTVYKGLLPNRREIAVKRLFLNQRHRAWDFYNEVNIISSVDHKNLVKLVGFSCSGPESILIYEYLPNRSLNHFIFDAVRGKELNWGKRYDIIVGIAEGLAYLHENNKTRIIHRDIKAANILLDSRLNAKIADFGLARSFKQDKNHISTGIAGTLGYMAPEYIAYGKLSEKVDVYSYGVLLLEIVSGMPNRGIRTSEDPSNLISIAWGNYMQGSMEELFDQNLMLNNGTSSKLKKEIERVIHIGLLCVQEVASLRPTMSMAIQMLSKNIDPLPSPSNPPYMPDSTIKLNGSVPILMVNNHASVPTVSYSSNDNKLLKILNSSSLNVRYSTIEKATASFDEANKLGQGGFGAVYKGVLPNGREIAVKRLFFNHRHRACDFYNEVNMISSVNHKNLVKLVGFSCLGPESALIYEYLPNRSLDHFIFDPIKGKKLNWAKRFDIIFGIAEGLVYLHENTKTRIIHRDIKAANILLDSTLCAKIADFGLARSFQQDKNHISTGIAGTLGYMAPEYVTHGQLTEKVDVYSFGVLILEVVTGMPNRGTQTSEYTQNLVSMVWNHFKQGSVSELFDRNLMLQNDAYDGTKEEMESVVHVGLLCIQEVVSLRPTMSMALQMLSKNIKPLPAPANPPFTSASNIQVTEFSTNQALQLRLNNHASVPTVSDSFFGPR